MKKYNMNNNQFWNRMSISLINLYGQGYGRDEESYKAANSYLPGIHMLIEYEITEIFYLRNFWPDETGAGKKEHMCHCTTKRRPVARAAAGANSTREPVHCKSSTREQLRCKNSNRERLRCKS